MDTGNERLRILLCIGAVIVAVGAAVMVGGVIDPGSRAESTVPERLVVSYADLDVNTVDGAAVLFHRIWVAAAEACPSDSRDLARRAIRRSCIDRAVVEAVAQINTPLLSERYLANMKADTPAELVAVRRAE